MKPRLSTPVLFVLLFVATRSVSGQCRLFTDQGNVRAAIDRGRAIVSASFGRSPTVQFYDKTGQGWQPGQSFDLGDFHLLFDLPVAMDGDRALAGNCESAELSGQAFVFDRVGDQWVQSELVSATVVPGDFFGASIALDGNVAVVGAAHWGQGGGDELARMHVFEFDGTSWSEVAQILPYTTEVDVEGDTIVLGDISDLGSVHEYRKVAGIWTWKNRLRVPTTPDGPYFGSSVALQGDTLAVGAGRSTVSVEGYVKIFRRQGFDWQEVQHIVSTAGTSGYGFGSGVALSGSTLLVGTAAGQGLVHRFQYDGTNYVEAGHFGPDPGRHGIGSHMVFQREDAIFSDDYDSVSFYRLGFADQSSFCPTTPNSTGFAGALSVEGCDSLGGQRFTLIASGLPVGVLGVFFFGADTTQVPFGNGFRCVGEPFLRFPGGTTGATGQLAHDVDFTSSPASRITAGRTWHFQAVYRDLGAGAQLNLTNALSIRITP